MAHADTTVDVAVEAHVDVHVSTQGTTSSSGGNGDRDRGLLGGTPLTRGHWEVGLAMILPVHHHDIGAHAIVGRQLGPVRLALEYSMSSTCADRKVVDDWGAVRMAQVGAQVHRVGVAGRYRLDFGMDDVGTAFYLEGGVGREQLRWRDGAPSTTHNDVAVGFGVDMLGGGRQLAGFDFGGRFTLTEGDTPDAPTEVTAGILLGFLLGT